MKKFITRVIVLFITSLFMQQLLQQETRACNIAVITASASSTGRPFIWKNRDHATSYRHQVLYFPEVKTGVGGSTRLMGETFFNGTTSPKTVCTGGANESGFAITNTTCIDTTNDSTDAYNVNTNLMEKALEQCKTLSEFETLANGYKTYWSKKSISGIFAVIDAQGGAAIYEMWTNGLGKTLMFRKFNVNTGAVTDEKGAASTDIKYTQTVGFNNRTNTNHTRGWIDIPSDSPREIRARQLLTSMQNKNELSPYNIMRFVSKDVCGGTPKDYFYNPDDPAEIVINNWDTGNADNDTYLTPNRDGEMFTRYCISRYMTTMGLVIEGVAKDQNPGLTTMWVSLGEPALSVFVPFFPYAQQVSKYATDNKHSNSGYYWDGVSKTTSPKPSSFLNILFDCVEANPFSSNNYPELNNIYKGISLYANNGCPYWIYPDGSTRSSPMDATINYPRLVALQNWTFPLEDIVFAGAKAYLAQLKTDSTLVTRTGLADFSNYCCQFVYKNYSNQSASYMAWNYQLPQSVDKIAPSISSVSPGNGAASIPVNRKVEVLFSEPLTASTLTSASFTLYNVYTRSNVAGSVSYNADTRLATFTPSRTLANRTRYRITLTTAIKDLAGNSLAANYTSYFTTISFFASAIAPALISLNTSAEFPVNGIISLEFSKEIDETTVNEASFKVFNGVIQVAGSVVYDPDSKTAIFTPVSQFDPDTTFTVVLTSDITDLSGKPLSETSWTFKTGSTISLENPVVVPVSDAFSNDVPANSGGCGSSALAATSGGSAQHLLSGLASLLGTMLIPLSLICINRRRRKK